MIFDKMSWAALVVILLANIGTNSAAPVSTALGQPSIPQVVDLPAVSIRTDVPKYDLPSTTATPEEISEDDVALSKRRMMVYSQIRYVGHPHYLFKRVHSNEEPEPESELEEKEESVNLSKRSMPPPYWRLAGYEKRDVVEEAMPEPAIEV